MSLRVKLFLVALVALVLPWAGFQFVRQMEILLREGQEAAQLDAAEALARALVATAPELPLAARAIQVAPVPTGLLIDGSGDDWASVPLIPERAAGGSARLKLAASAGALFGYLEVDDRSRSRAPGMQDLRQFDHISIDVGEGSKHRHFDIGNAAPGALQFVAEPPDAEFALRGEWQETTTGYRLEFVLSGETDDIPIDLLVHDREQNGQVQIRSLVRERGDELRSRLWRSDGAQARALEALVPEHTRLRLLSSDGEVLAKAGRLPVAERASGRPPPEFGTWIYRLLLAPPLSKAEDFDWELQRMDLPMVWQALGGLRASTWRPSASERTVIVAAAVPMAWQGDVRGALVLERSSEAMLVLANRAVAKLIAASLIAVLVAGVVLFGFAGVLSFRIQRLRNATERALKPDGRLDVKLPHLTASDEIGDLSRSFQKLLAELGGYNDYLKTLASKLSHELNTPLAIVRSSLDNLEHEPLPESARIYAERARDGADRLWAILRTMAEASRMEKAISAAEPEQFELGQVVRGCAESYQALAGTRKVHLMLPPDKLPFYGAPDLIAQALDKLYDNARGFTPEDGWIRIKLSVRADEQVEIAVANSGPPLPARMQEKLFDSLVSVRDAGSLRAAGEVPHLGLGLYIVRLIAAAHQGFAEASNLPQDAGVEFRMVLSGMNHPAP